MSSGEKTNLTLFSASRFFNWRRSSTNSCHHDNVDQPFDHLQHILGLGQLSLWPRLGHLLNPTDSFQLSIFILNSKGRPPQKKTFFFGRSLPNLFTHPRILRFERTKGEIRVEKGDFRVIWGVLRGLDLVWESATPPTHIWERSPKKRFFTPSLYEGQSHWLGFRVFR